jgi:hypothetical protein
MVSTAALSSGGSVNDRAAVGTCDHRARHQTPELGLEAPKRIGVRTIEEVLAHGGAPVTLEPAREHPVVIAACSSKCPPAEWMWP